MVRHNIPILISENGREEMDKLEENNVVNAKYIIQYLKTYIKTCKEEVTDGVELLGYCAGPFTDLLNWLDGYKKSYGLVYVDRSENDSKGLKIINKKSFYWYEEVIKQM